MPAIAPLATPELASFLDTSEQPQQASFLGTLARTADKAKLALAQAMEVKRASPEEIWNATGWFRGADTKWRFEISDTDAKFKFNPKTHEIMKHEIRLPFDEVYEHPELWAAHPELGKVPFGVKKMRDPTTLGEFAGPDIPGGPYINLNKSLKMKEMYPIIAHEMQHGIQGREGFAIGGNPQWPITSSLDVPLPREAIAEQIRMTRQLTDAEYANYLKNRSSFTIAGRNWRANEHYLRQAGEVEANNVMKRLGWTPEQLRATPPWVSQPIPSQYQFVNFNMPPGLVLPRNPASYLDTSILRTRY